MNRFYRTLLFISAILAFIFVLHRGRTDSNGGHYNHSTGEYHYHHGYSAHDHYDMNGDGIVDCPYSFKDNPSYQSSTSKSSANTIDISKSTGNKKHGSSFKSFLKSVLLVICSILVSVAMTVVPWALRSIFSAIKKYTNRK